MKPKKLSKPSADSHFANAEMQHIEQLLRFMSEHNLEEFEYSQGDLRIRLKKPSVGTARTSVPEIIVATAAESRTLAASASAAPGPSPAPESGRSSEDMHLVKSPIVGTFY